MYKTKIELGWLPEPVGSILETLKNEKGLAIRGGTARLALLESQVRHGKTINPRRLERERQKMDLDIILIRHEALPKAKADLLKQAEEIKERLKSIPSLIFTEDGIEPFRGEIDDQGRIDESTIQRILSTRDLTMNEVILANESGQWWMYYSTRCWRDALLGVGMINARDPGLARWDLGRIVPNHRGFYRLFRAFVENIAERIWLPQWQVTTHLLEMGRLQALKKVPIGTNFGYYPLLIARRYENAPREMKIRWVQLLRRLRFTDTQDWEMFIAEQKFIEASANGKEFKINDLSTLQVTIGAVEEMNLATKIDHLIETNRKRQEGQQERKQMREKCEHQLEPWPCEGCSVRCVIQKCQKCTKFSLPTPVLPCNEIFIAGNWKADEGSLLSWRDVVPASRRNFR